MFNMIKVCPKCDWNRPYDEGNDLHGVSLFQRCPECGMELRTQPYSPMGDSFGRSDDRPMRI
jgi:hypothetical protein